MLNYIVKSQKTNNKLEKILNTHSTLPIFLIFKKSTTHSNRKVKKKKKQQQENKHNVPYRTIGRVYEESRGFPSSPVGKESSCNAGDPGLIPGLGKSPGEGNGNPLQYSCLENPWTEEPGRL